MARREYVDKRNWVEYNEKLVRRGELYFSFEFLDSWSNHLALANEGKVGRRYEFPEPFIQHLMMLHIILKASYWSEPLRVDNELSNINSWREVYEKDEATLRPRIQDLSSSRT